MRVHGDLHGDDRFVAITDSGEDDSWLVAEVQEGTVNFFLVGERQIEMAVGHGDQIECDDRIVSLEPEEARLMLGMLQEWLGRQT